MKEVQEVHFQQKNQQVFQEMLVIHEQEKIRAKNKLLEADVSLQRTKIQSLIVILIGAFLAFAIIFILYLRVQKQMKALYRNAVEFASTPSGVGIDLVPDLNKEASSLVDVELEVEEDESNAESNQPEKFKELFVQITSLLESEKLYLNPIFSKSELVQHLATNEKYIYQAINQFSGKNFNQFINAYRIKESIQLLQQPQRPGNLDELAEMSGFNSRASFYRHFSDVTGLTPTQFLQMQSKEIQNN